jgi:hypothetical protein
MFILKSDNMKVDSPVIGSEESMYFDGKPDLMKIEKRIEKYGEANRQINKEDNGEIIGIIYTENIDQRTAKEEFVELLEECGEMGYLNHYAFTSEGWENGEVMATGDEESLESYLEDTHLEVRGSQEIKEILSRKLANPR